MDYWLKFKDNSYEWFYKSLFTRSERTRYVTKKTFTKQVDSFLCKTKLSSLQEWRRPNSQRIFSNVRTWIMRSHVQTLSDLDRGEAIATLSNITLFKLSKEVICKSTKVTDYGWFLAPHPKLNKWFASDNITREEYEYLKVVNKQFDNMDLLLSHYTNSGDFFKILVDQIDKKTIPPEINPEMTQLDRYIANEIMLDLGKLIKMYK